MERTRTYTMGNYTVKLTHLPNWTRGDYSGTMYAFDCLAAYLASELIAKYDLDPEDACETANYYYPCTAETCADWED